MKVKKIFKIIAIIIMCTFLIEVLYPITSSYASFLGGAQSESRPAPRPPSPPPSSGGGGGGGSSGGGSSGGGSGSGNNNNNNNNTETTPDDDNTTETPSGPPATQHVYEYRYVRIEGNAYEDLGYDISTTGGVDSQKKTGPIEGITVELYQGDSLVDRKLTAADGSYVFEPSPGTYSIKYRYGDTSLADPSNTELMQKILKYNGQDYITVSVPGNQEYINTEQIAVQQSGKGVLQLFIALDCSSSMINEETKVDYNGKEMTRLEVVVDSAKELCKSLIDSGDNIYIGLVFFKGTSYRSVSLTKDLNRLNAALDNAVSIANTWESYNTNVYGALDKTYESYYNNDPETSNRFLTILTDGVPTSDGTTELYSDDSESTAYSKLDTIAETTGARLRSLRENGIKVISLVTESQEEDPNEYALETQYVQKVFSGGNSDIFESIQDGYKTVDMIKEKLKDYLITNTTTKEEYTEVQIISGYENEQRRQEVDEQFETMDYNNTSMFQQIDSYTSNEEANKLSTATYMDVQGGEGYLIQDCPADKVITAVWPETGETYIAMIIHYVPVAYENQDIILARRPGFSLVTKITATGLRVVLQNGQVIDIQEREPGDNFPIIESLDNELAYGTLIQIEYTVAVKNDSSIQCNYLEMLNYLPTGFVYDDSISLITKDGTNKDTGWELAALDELHGQNLVTQETVDNFTGNVTLKLTLDNAGQGADGFYIPSGGECEIKYVVSRMISSLDDIEDGDFEIASEVLRYKDSANRRMEYVNEATGVDTTTVGATIQNYKGAYPGDSKDQDYADDSTNEVIIIPPTGRQKNDITISEMLSKSVFSSIIDRIRK